MQEKERQYVLYLNSLANVHSENRIKGTCQEVFGVSQEEWDEMAMEEKDETAREVAFTHMLEWGWYEK